MVAEGSFCVMISVADTPSGCGFILVGQLEHVNVL